MKRSKSVATRNSSELAKALNLLASDGAEIDLRSALNSKIIDAIRAKELTHQQVARMACTSRTRVTAILNRNTKDVSTDFHDRSLSRGQKLSRRASGGARV